MSKRKEPKEPCYICGGRTGDRVRLTIVDGKGKPKQIICCRKHEGIKQLLQDQGSSDNTTEASE